MPTTSLLHTMSTDDLMSIDSALGYSRLVSGNAAQTMSAIEDNALIKKNEGTEKDFSTQALELLSEFKDTYCKTVECKADEVYNPEIRDRFTNFVLMRRMHDASKEVGKAYTKIAGENNTIKAMDAQKNYENLLQKYDDIYLIARTKFKGDLGKLETAYEAANGKGSADAARQQFAEFAIHNIGVVTQKISPSNTNSLDLSGIQSASLTLDTDNNGVIDPQDNLLLRQALERKDLNEEQVSKVQARIGEAVSKEHDIRKQRVDEHFAPPVTPQINEKLLKGLRAKTPRMAG